MSEVETIRHRVKGFRDRRDTNIDLFIACYASQNERSTNWSKSPSQVQMIRMVLERSNINHGLRVPRTKNQAEVVMVQIRCARPLRATTRLFLERTIQNSKTMFEDHVKT